MPERDFIQSRLETLDEIDDNVVKLLDNIETVFDIYSEPSKQDCQQPSDIKETLESGVRDVYSSLSSIAIGLRNEIKIMDENIGVFDRNEDLVMILPISVEQKSTTLGKKKLREEVEKLRNE